MASEDTFLFTSESVNEGHPDKLCDQISDADACLCPALFLSANVDYEKIIHNTCNNIGFVSDDDVGLDTGHCKVPVNIEQQSPDIKL